MELEDQSIPATTRYVGVDDVEVAAGTYVQIRYGTLMDPTTLLEQQVPAGKVWRFQVNVEITETDA